MTSFASQLTHFAFVQICLVSFARSGQTADQQNRPVDESETADLPSGSLVSLRFWSAGSVQELPPHVSQRPDAGEDAMTRYELSDKYGMPVVEKLSRIDSHRLITSREMLQTNIESTTAVSHSSQVNTPSIKVVTSQRLYVDHHQTESEGQSSEVSPQPTKIVSHGSHVNPHSKGTTGHVSLINKLTMTVPSSDRNPILYQKQSTNIQESEQVKIISPRFANIRSSLDETVGRYTHWNLPTIIHLKVMSGPDCELTENDTMANCSYRNLTTIPDHGICYTITTFDLHNNSIDILPNHVFINFSRLQHLDLSNNTICKIEIAAFSGLGELITLNLRNNLLAMSDSTFLNTVFSDLHLLQDLRIHRNNKNCKNSTLLNYPDTALSYLYNLTSLSMDGLNNKTFGPGFQNLTRLVNLSLAGYDNGYCHMHSLLNVTFQYLINLKHLDISDCYILGNHIEAGVFSPLQNLVSLSLTHNEDIDISNLDNVFFGLREITSLKYLYMNQIVNRYSVGVCLDSSYIKNFPKHLENFEAQENTIEGLDRQVISILSPSLRTLDVSGNKFVFGTYLRDLNLMTSLTHLKLNGKMFAYTLPEQYPYEMSIKMDSGNCTLYGTRKEDVDQINLFTLNLPPNLQEIEMNSAGLSYVLTKLTVNTSNQLQSLSMHNNYFPSLIGPFTGLHSLRYLDISSSFVRAVSNSFFTDLTTLQTLNMSGNILGDFLSNQPDPRVFWALTNLKFLDLSFNDIHFLSENIFCGLISLQILLLHRNSLIEFAVNISHIPSLISLNLSINTISSLAPAIQNHFDLLIAKGYIVTIDMSQCPILCTCDSIDFLVWMKHSKAFNHKFEDYKCVFEENLYTNITDGYNKTIQFLLKHCASHQLIYFSVAITMCVVLCVIVCTILYQFRWKLRYLYYAARLAYKSSCRGNTNTEFEFDAFICYAEEDHDFVINTMAHELEKRGLKLCVHERDFLAGEFIVSNIVRAVRASRRTVVVLTRHLIDSYWCAYEVQMANMEAVHSRRQVLIFLLMEKIPHNALGKELLYHIRNNTYIPYPQPLPGATSMGRLWSKMVDDILA